MAFRFCERIDDWCCVGNDGLVCPAESSLCEQSLHLGIHRICWSLDDLVLRSSIVVSLQFAVWSQLRTFDAN